MSSKIIRSILDFGARIYGFCVNAAMRHYQGAGRVKKVGTRVVSIGNITWGGTGKTPLVMMLARALSAKGKRVAVLTRGYGHDEAHELKNQLSGVPIYVGRDRVKSAEAAIKEHQAEIILLDDGFQHWGLHRDCDVVTINSTNAFGNGSLIPRGCLREPVQNLGRADVFVITNAALGRNSVNLIHQKLKELNPRALVFEADHEPVRFVDVLNNRTLETQAIRGRKTAVLSGIEDPSSFERTLEKLGATLVYAARFNDHHAFTRAEISEVMKACRELEVDYLVTTSKDYYRLGRVLKQVDIRSVKILVLHIEIRMDDDEEFVRKCGNL